MSKEESNVIVSDGADRASIKTIFDALAYVHRSVSFLKKENKGYNFNFVSSSQALLAIRQKMDEAGLILVPSMTNVKAERYAYKSIDRKTSKELEKLEYFTEIWFDMTWVFVKDPSQTLQCKWYGQGMADGEQGVGIAATYAEKFFILKFFNIATDEQDPDYIRNQTSADDARRQPANRQQQVQGKKPDSKPIPENGKPEIAKAKDPAPPKTEMPKFIALVLSDKKLAPLVQAYMSLHKVDKQGMRNELQALWNNSKGNETVYRDSIMKFVSIPDPAEGEPPKEEKPGEQPPF